MRTTNADDILWIDSLRVRAAKVPLATWQRNFILRELRVKLRADYLFWGCGVQDPITFEGITADYFDDADDADVMLRGSQASREDKVQSKFAGYAWAAHTLNNAGPSNRVLGDLMRATNQKLVTVEQGFLRKCASFRTKLGMIMRPTLLKRRSEVGLDDFMLSLRRLGPNASGGIGYHRAFRVDPNSGKKLAADPFTERDRAFAHIASERLDDILYNVRVDMAALERLCTRPRQRLTYWERVALPLLLSDNLPTEADVAIVMRAKPTRVANLRRSICSKLQLEHPDLLASQQRKALYSLFFPNPRDSAWDLAESRLDKALEDLRGAQQVWEMWFVEKYKECILGERRRKSKT